MAPTNTDASKDAKDSKQSTTTATSTTKSGLNKKELPHLPPLEADDEFEDFPAEDWEENETYGAALARSTSSTEAGASTTGGPDAKVTRAKGLDSLWEDSWDDDDVADDFSVQLRGELQRQNQMQT